MTPAHTDSPLRRSEAGIFRDNAQNSPQTPQHNDDDEERRQARRRTLNSTLSEDASIIEQSETLKKCLAIFHENKLSRDNAWSLSLIDTVSTLLARHHKSLNNFTVAGSSLEASSKVYGLRVDSVHTDVLRMSAGLNARKFRGNGQDDDDDGVATGGEGGADPNSSANTGADPSTEPATKKRKAKRTRKAVSTVTKNKETLNARLDTVPLQDPVFGKLNTVVGSINASNRLMNNMLHSVDAELRLRMTHKCWDSSNVDEDCDYTVLVPLDDIPEKELLPWERLSKIERYEKQLLRPMMSGYVISDTPDRSIQEKDPIDFLSRNNETGANAIDESGTGLLEIERQEEGGGGGVAGGGDVSMAFDMNADCEPLPVLNSYAPIIAVDEQDYDEFTAEEHNTIAICRGLRKSAVVLEDMRPINSTSNLEYSYRPVEKISQFWAGPSHWRFRRTRHRPSALGQTGNSQQTQSVGRTLNVRNRKMNALQSKKRLRVQFAAPIHDAQFIMIDAKFKSRKTNFQKKWDQRKLRLPTDLQLHADKLVNHRFFAPAIRKFNFDHSSDENDDRGILVSQNDDDEHFNAIVDHDIAADDDMFGGGDAIPNANESAEMSAAAAERIASFMDENQLNGTNNPANDTVLEIATDFEGAPRQVTKIIVPFAKRAKVIDMKNLKRTCTHLITKQLRENEIPESIVPQHLEQNTEKYATGVASFQKVFKSLPPLLTATMAEGLTPSIALYSVLHLANDLSYRLIPTDDLSDFYIRQVLDE